MKKSITWLVALFAALSCGAQVPQRINYQGRLLSGTNLVNGNVGLSLRLFNVPSGGSPQYEDSNSVAVADGLYSTFIGLPVIDSHNPIASRTEQLLKRLPPMLYTAPAVGRLWNASKARSRSTLWMLSRTCLPLYP